MRTKPGRQQEQLKPELRALFSQKDRQAADQALAAFIEKYQYPTAIACLPRDLEACLTFYAFPKEHWKTIRTNNVAASQKRSGNWAGRGGPSVYHQAYPR